MRRLLKLCLVLGLTACGQNGELASHTDARRGRMDRPDQRVAQRLADGEVRTLAVEAYSHLFNEAARYLEKRQHEKEAEELLKLWNEIYIFQVLGLKTDMGDHAPLDEWLATEYQKLEDLLGVDVMELTHLRDIFVLNFSTPVVFNAEASNAWCIDQLTRFPFDTCKAEYGRHFTGTKWTFIDPFATRDPHHGFSGVVSYWISFVACEATFWGTDGTFVCGLAATAIENGMEMTLSPSISDALYDKANAS